MKKPKQDTGKWYTQSEYASLKGLTRQRVSAMVKAKHPKLEIKVNQFGRTEVRDK